MLKQSPTDPSPPDGDGPSAPVKQRKPARREDDRLFCKGCRAEITRTRWALIKDGVHERTVANPSGKVFTIRTFKEAPGLSVLGSLSAEFTWFKGYQWRVAVCGHCGAHLGWRFDGLPLPQVFYALIKNRLTTKPPKGEA